MGANHWLKAATGVALLCERDRLDRRRQGRRACGGNVEQGHKIVFAPDGALQAGAGQGRKDRCYGSRALHLRRRASRGLGTRKPLCQIDAACRHWRR